MVHGDIKGVRDCFKPRFTTILTGIQPNILVDATGQARITDFGLATITQNLDSIRCASGDQGYTARWTAPEILNEEGTYSEEADVFSFAMVMVEVCYRSPPVCRIIAYPSTQVFTGAVPFGNCLPAAAMLAIMSGGRPPRPVHPALTDGLWTMMQLCWGQDPHSRPEVFKVFEVLDGSWVLSFDDRAFVDLTIFSCVGRPFPINRWKRADVLTGDHRAGV